MALKRTILSMNDTELPIEILGSTWFTAIIRSEGFIEVQILF